jgi:hypothetical protein
MSATTAAGYAPREVTHSPPWHDLVVWDIFFNAVATGVFMVAAAGELARPGVFAPAAAWAFPVALVVLLVDLTCLVLDLGDPLRFHHMLRVVKLSSPMSLGTWCLTLFSFPLAAVVGLDALGLVGLLPPDSPTVGVVRTVLLVAALPFAFGSMAYKGVLFSTSAQPGWKDARWLGAYHVASAFALGAVGLLALGAVTGHPDVVRTLAPAAAVLLVGQAVPLVLLGLELRPAVARSTVRGAFRLTAVVALGVGVILPLPLLISGGPGPAVGAAVAALVGAWAVRHFVITLPHHVAHPKMGDSPAER